jgi:uncharacterized membrane protein YkoI
MVLAVVGAAGVLWPAAAAAEEDRHDEAVEHDHDRARQALEQGEVRPLEEIEAAVRARFPGEVAEIEFEREHGIWIYEFKVIDRAGRLLEIKIDAGTGRFVEVEGE